MRHRIVHRHLPSLAELKIAAKDSLDWLWEWYWSQLDFAFGITKGGEEQTEVEGVEAVREKLQGILKTYVKERKNEIKTRKKTPTAAQNAISTYNLRYAPKNTLTPSSRVQTLLLRLLIDERMVLPTARKLGSSMSGAFLIWDQLLLAFTQSEISINSLVKELRDATNSYSMNRGMMSMELDPVREGLYEWTLHILRSEEWSARREQQHSRIEDTLVECFSSPAYWNLKLAATVLEDTNTPNREQWLAVLEAARAEDVQGTTVNGETMDLDIDAAQTPSPVLEPETQDNPVKEKLRGPRKMIGPWIPRPIGWFPPGQEQYLEELLLKQATIS